MQKIIQGKLFEEKENSVFKYDVAVSPALKTQEEPAAAWKGKPIPYDTWRQIISFFKAQYKKCDAEGMVRGYYNEQTKKWLFHAFPQEYSGLAVMDKLDDAQYAQYIGEGFILAATVHHHCTTTAFQSGKDHEDETTKTGIHITVGEIDKPEMDFHCRIVVNKMMYKGYIADIVDVPLGYLGKMKLTNEFMEDLLGIMLSQGDVEFPAIWLENCKKKEYQSYGYGSDHDFPGLKDRAWTPRPTADIIDNSGEDYFDALSDGIGVQSGMVKLFTEQEVREMVTSAIDDTITDFERGEGVGLALTTILETIDDPTIPLGERIDRIREIAENPTLI